MLLKSGLARESSLMSAKSSLIRILRAVLILGGIAAVVTASPSAEKFGIATICVVISLASVSLGMQLDRDRETYKKRHH